MRLIQNKTVVIRYRSLSTSIALMVEESANKYGYKIVKQENEN